MIGQLLGEPIVQNVQGTLLYDVRDSGQDVASGARFSVTNYESSFHTDNSFGETVARLRRPALPEDGAVRRCEPGCQRLCRRRGPRREDPGALECSAGPSRLTAEGASGSGEAPTVLRPAIELGGPVPLFRYLPLLDRGRAREGRRAPDPRAARALDRLDEVLNRPALRAEFALEPGQVYLINNRWVLHNRTAFEDHPEPERRRHLVRLWLEARNGLTPRAEAAGTGNDRERRFRRTGRIRRSRPGFALRGAHFILNDVPFSPNRAPDAASRSPHATGMTTRSRMPPETIRPWIPQNPTAG